MIITKIVFKHLLKDDILLAFLDWFFEWGRPNEEIQTP